MKKVQLKVNGLSRQVVVDPQLTLLDLLRDGLHLTGAKQSCDKKGQCGACTVLVDGKAVRSCLAKVIDLDGADVITVEGLGTPENPHLIQVAFVLSGAIQCGFCTPGMIMATKALLDRNPNPSTEEIRRALRGNLCRCTGYVKIVDAVKLAGSFLRGECTPEEIWPDPDGSKIGVSHPRPTALLKACGVAQFSADILLPGALEAAVVRSPHPHARIRGIDSSAAEGMHGVVGVMTAKDIKGTNRLKIVVEDRPLLCEDRVRSIGDPVAIVVAETRAQALAAAEAVAVDYELLPVYSSPQESMAGGAMQIHPQWPNVCYVQPLAKGDAEKALAESTAVIEARFTTQLNHQAPLEPEATLAYLEGEGEDAQLVVIGRSINIHKHLQMLQEALGWEDMRYEEAFTGGQFGIKIEVTSEGISAAAALHFRRPVRYIPSLAESMALTPKRHPYDMVIKLGADAEAHLTAFTMDFLVDNGAYTSTGQAMVNRAIWMLNGSYHIPNVRAFGQLVYTNNPYGSSARGAGPPQQHFALECAMDMLAKKMGIDPLDFRIRNSLKPGQTKSSGPEVEQWPFPELCEAIRPHYDRSRTDAAAHKSGTIRRGVGLGAGAFGVGGSADMASVAVELNPDNGVTIYAACADPGEGNDSMLTQLASDAMGIPMDKVRLAVKSTEQTTASGPAAGSRITFMMGGAMLIALDMLKQSMAEVGATDYQSLKASGRPIRYLGTKKNPGVGTLDPKSGQGATFDSQIHAIQLAEVEVNTDTGEVRVLKMTTATDAGTIIHPLNVITQVEGGMDQGVGWALREQFIPGETRDWATFKFPTMRTAFDMEVITRETPRVRGAKGATGIGEMTLVPTAPAVVNAIYDACGIRIQDLPATPEKVKAALAEKK
jgi:aldehyde oxidoreductase